MHKTFAFIFRKTRLIVLTICLILPFVLLPLALSPLKESKCAYVIILVTAYWLLEPIHISVTALLPLVLLPTLGVMNSSDVANSYMNESFMMFIGGLIVAIAVENCKLHERIALKVLLLVGTEIKWLILGFMLTTMFLSMWMSNVGTTAMMVPIAEAIMEEITSNTGDTSEMPLAEVKGSLLEDSTENNIEDGLQKRNSKRKISLRNSALKTTLLLSICYAANIGGTSTLTGSGPNLIFKKFLDDTFPGNEELTFATWLLYNIPGMLSCVLIGWFYLYLMHIRCSTTPFTVKNKDGVRQIVKKRYEKLGSLKFQEATVIVLFLLLVFLWLFRDPKVFNGWSSLFSSDIKIGDSVPSMAVAILLFMLPSDPWSYSSSPPILEWRIVQSKLPWGVIILCGGGVALANASKRTGLSLLIGQQLTSLSIFPVEVIVVIVCIMTTVLTEVLSNTTIATILLPVISQMAISISVNPLFLLVPVTIACSYAFMLPVAAPTNAIAYESGQMKILDMAKPGLAMNLVCCCIQLLMINTLGAKIFNLNEFPSWANTTGHYTPPSGAYSDISSSVLYGINISHIYVNETGIFL